MEKTDFTGPACAVHMADVKKFFEKFGDKKVVFACIHDNGIEELFACSAFTLSLSRLFLLELSRLSRLSDVYKSRFQIATGADIAETIDELKSPDTFACFCTYGLLSFAIWSSTVEEFDDYIKVQLIKFM